jgi:hypothetical protein
MSTFWILSFGTSKDRIRCCCFCCACREYSIVSYSFKGFLWMLDSLVLRTPKPPVRRKKLNLHQNLTSHRSKKQHHIVARAHHLPQTIQGLGFLAPSP